MIGGATLDEILRERLPRLFAAGCDWNDVEAVRHSLASLDGWAEAWSRLAERHAERGRAALDAGHRVTAGDAFQRAALAFHVGQFVFFADAERKRRLQQRQRAAYAEAAPHLRPPAELLRIPGPGCTMAAHLRRPPGVARPPCVVLHPGADSTKEEFHSLEAVFLARGLATLSFDGPGQSLTWWEAKLRPDTEVAIAAVLDALGRRDDIDADRLGLWGRSFGGYAVLRAAGDPRLRACVSIGGFYDLARIWQRMPVSTQESLAFGFGARDLTEARAHVAAYTLDGALTDVGCPVLVVHSGGDTVCPVAEAQRMADALGARAELAVYPHGNHVCDNIPFEVRPRMADWLAACLGAVQAIP